MVWKLFRRHTFVLSLGSSSKWLSRELGPSLVLGEAERSLSIELGELHSTTDTCSLPAESLAHLMPMTILFGLLDLLLWLIMILTGLAERLLGGLIEELLMPWGGLIEELLRLAGLADLWIATGRLLGCQVRQNAG